MKRLMLSLVTVGALVGAGAASAQLDPNNPYCASGWENHPLCNPYGYNPNVAGGYTGGYYGNVVPNVIAQAMGVNPYGYVLPQQYGVVPQQYADRDGDGIADHLDRDRDGDGVRNNRDRYPDDPRFR